MNLYLISQDVNDDYDTYDSCVVCAATVKNARMIHPSGDKDWSGEDDKIYSSWCAAKDVSIKLIGIAGKNIKIGVVCASYNAG